MDRKRRRNCHRRQRQLYQALNAHQFDLEIERAAAPSDLEEQTEATRLVLKWLEKATVRQARLEARKLH
jgi:hypothetical protein